MDNLKELANGLLLLDFENEICNRQRLQIQSSAADYELGGPEKAVKRAVDDCEDRIQQIRNEILSRMHRSPFD